MLNYWKYKKWYGNISNLTTLELKFKQYFLYIDFFYKYYIFFVNLYNKINKLSFI